MSPAAVVMLGLFAFLSAPAAFVLVWILYRQTGNRSERYLALAVLAISFVLLGNLLAGVIEAVPHPPYSVSVLLLDEVTIFTIMGGAYLCLLAHEVTRTRLPGWLAVLFWGCAFLLHTVILASAILPASGGAGRSVTKGYTTATLWSLLMLAYATIVFIVGRRRVPADFVFPRPVRLMVALLVLGTLSAANDIFQIGSRLGGVGIPFSPFFAIVINGFIIVVVGRRLVGEARATSAADSISDRGGVEELGLTLRESEILPLLLDGKSNEEIGEKLHISPHTVKNHISVIFRKAGATNRFDLLKAFKRKTTPAQRSNGI